MLACKARKLPAHVKDERAFTAWLSGNTVARNRLFLATRDDVIITPRRKADVELSVEERRAATPGIYARRMKLTLKGDSERQDAVRQTIVPHCPADEPKENFDLHRHTKPDKCPHCPGDGVKHGPVQPIQDILEDSWVWQREFRWSDPEGYEQYVADLEEEMGGHFEEWLVLPRKKLDE